MEPGSENFESHFDFPLSNGIGTIEEKKKIPSQSESRKLDFDLIDKIRQSESKEDGSLPATKFPDQELEEKNKQEAEKKKEEQKPEPGKPEKPIIVQNIFSDKDLKEMVFFTVEAYSAVIEEMTWKIYGIPHVSLVPELQKICTRILLEAWMETNQTNIRKHINWIVFAVILAIPANSLNNGRIVKRKILLGQVKITEEKKPDGIVSDPVKSAIEKAREIERNNVRNYQELDLKVPEDSLNFRPTNIPKSITGGKGGRHPKGCTCGHCEWSDPNFKKKKSKKRQS